MTESREASDTFDGKDSVLHFEENNEEDFLPVDPGSNAPSFLAGFPDENIPPKRLCRACSIPEKSKPFAWLWKMFIPPTRSNHNIDNYRGRSSYPSYVSAMCNSEFTTNKLFHMSSMDGGDQMSWLNWNKWTSDSCENVVGESINMHISQPPNITAFSIASLLLLINSITFILLHTLLIAPKYSEEDLFAPTYIPIILSSLQIITLLGAIMYCMLCKTSSRARYMLAFPLVHGLLGLTRSFVSFLTFGSEDAFFISFYSYYNFVDTVGVAFTCFLYVRIRLRICLVPLSCLLTLSLPSLIMAAIKNQYGLIWLFNNIAFFLVFVHTAFLYEKQTRLLANRVKRSAKQISVLEALIKRTRRNVPSATGHTPFELVIEYLAQVERSLEEEISETVRREIIEKVTRVLEALRGASNLFEIHDIHDSNPYVKQFIERVKDNDSNEFARKTTFRKKMKMPSSNFQKYRATTSLVGLIGNCWSFDCLSFAQENPNVLTFVGWTLLNPLCNAETLNIETVLSFLRVVETNYFSHPYHNSTHGAAVCHMTMVLSAMTNAQSFMSEMDEITLIVAALCHDVGHPGRDNKFLVRIKDKLALRYNDASVLENHHASLTFQILETKGCNFLSKVEDNVYRLFRKRVIELILSTDMKFHFETISIFRAKRMTELNYEENEDDLWKLLAICLKCADLGHAACEWNVHHQWCELVVEEFYAQGDEEASLGLEKSFLCDRQKHTTDFCKLQISFIDLLVKPLFVELAAVESETQDITGICLKNIDDNIRIWTAKEKEEND